MKQNLSDSIWFPGLLSVLLYSQGSQPELYGGCNENLKLSEALLAFLASHIRVSRWGTHSSPGHSLYILMHVTHQSIASEATQTLGRRTERLLAQSLFLVPYAGCNPPQQGIPGNKADCRSSTADPGSILSINSNHTDSPCHWVCSCL